MDRVINEIKEIAMKCNVSRVVLFGSRARGDNTVGSDYDIAVFCGDLKNEADFCRKIEEIETFNKIDIVFIKKRHLETELYCNILKDGIDIMNKFKIKLDNYKNAVARLSEAIDRANADFDTVIRDGVIQRFEFTTELAWKTVREYLILEGITEINSPKSTMAAAFSAGIIADDNIWLMILRDRNSTSHIYDEEEADEIYKRISTKYLSAFVELKNKLES